MARRFSGESTPGEDGAPREVCFREVDVAETVDQLRELMNIDDRS